MVISAGNALQILRYVHLLGRRQDHSVGTTDSSHDSFNAKRSYREATHQAPAES
jgi:hypothetical protein